MAIVAGFTAQSDIAVNPRSTAFQDEPQVAVLANGTTVVIWKSGNTIYAQQISGTGSLWGGTFIIGSSQDAAALSALPGGGFIVAWADSSNQVLVRAYGANGAP